MVCLGVTCVYQAGLHPDTDLRVSAETIRQEVCGNGKSCTPKVRLVDHRCTRVIMSQDCLLTLGDHLIQVEYVEPELREGCPDGTKKCAGQ